MWKDKIHSMSMQIIDNVFAVESDFVLDFSDNAGGGPPPPPPPPNGPNHWFELNGRRRTCKNAKEVLIGVFSELATQDHAFCQRFRERVPGRRRNILAKTREDLYPEHPERIRAAAELLGGWWIDTHSNNAQKKDWIKAACDVAGLKFGGDIIVHIP